jgi:hypothetical protein
LRIQPDATLEQATRAIIREKKAKMYNPSAPVDETEKGVREICSQLKKHDDELQLEAFHEGRGC